jgi:hypothetical protein
MERNNMPINKNVAAMVDALATKDATTFQSAFDSEIRDRVNGELDSMKSQIAQQLINPPTSEEAPVEAPAAEVPAQ